MDEQSGESKEEEVMGEGIGELTSAYTAFIGLLLQTE